MTVVTLNYGKFLVQATYYEAGNEFAPTKIWSNVTKQKVVNQIPPSLASFEANKSFYNTDSGELSWKYEQVGKDVKM